MFQQTLSYEPVFLANAALGGRGASISFDQARPFFVQNRVRFRANWRTDAEPPRMDFGLGIEDAFLCACGRKLPVVIAQVDHVASQEHLCNGGGPVELAQTPAAGSMPAALTKEVFLLVRGGGVTDVKVKYVVRAIANQTRQPLPFATGRVAGAIPLPAPGQNPASMQPPGPGGASISPGYTGFWAQAYADVPLSGPEARGAVAAPHAQARPGLSTGLVSRNEAYFEYQTWAGHQTQLRRCQFGGGAKALTSDNAPLTLGALLTTDLTNFQLLCSLCNASKGGDSFRYQRSRPASEVFRVF